MLGFRCGLLGFEFRIKDLVKYLFVSCIFISLL